MDRSTGRAWRVTVFAIALAAILGGGVAAPTFAEVGSVDSDPPPPTSTPSEQSREPTTTPTEAPDTEPSEEETTGSRSDEGAQRPGSGLQEPDPVEPDRMHPPGVAEPDDSASSERATTHAGTPALTTPTANSFAPGIHRVGGDDRYETAMEISARFSPGVPVLYVATGSNFPDALSAAAAAAHHKGPLLLSGTDGLPPAVHNEVKRLAPQRIVVVGGEAVVGAPVFAELAALTPSITRLGASDRYQTSQLIIDDAFRSATDAFIATGRDFPDALSASAAAGAGSAPVYLVDGKADTIPASVILGMRSLGVQNVRIAGADGAVSGAIESALKQSGFTVTRHGGNDRYETTVAINEGFFSEAATAFLATGADFPDALAGAALAGQLRAPLYTSRAACLPAPVHAAVNALNPQSRVLLGQTGALQEDVAHNTECPPTWVKPASGRITGDYGPRAPICTSNGCSNTFHYATDIGTGCWAPIYAASNGVVVVAESVGTYGNFVQIDHGSRIATGYAHLANGGILVREGQTVSAGEQIGWSGETGVAIGCHLHFEVFRSGARIDPVPFMASLGVHLGT